MKTVTEVKLTKVQLAFIGAALIDFEGRESHLMSDKGRKELSDLIEMMEVEFDDVELGD